MNGILRGSQRAGSGDVPVIGLKGFNGGGSSVMDSAAIASGLAFLNGELEKRDPKLLEPLTSTTWPRDIAVDMGGGWVEHVTNYDVNYSDAGGGENGLGRGQTTEIPAIQVDTSKNWWDVFTFLRKLHVPLVDQALLQTAGRSLDEMMNKGLHLTYDKTVDENVYLGFERLGTYGLVNNPNVLISSVPTGAKGSTMWSTKTPDEILDDVNLAINETWTRSEFDLQGMANHILIPPESYKLLVGRRIGEGGQVSILTFLLENNVGQNQGINVAIFPSRWCIGAGIGGTGRMVAYANNRDTVEFDMTVPLTRTITQASAEHHAYISAYAAQFSEVKFKRLQPVAYYDGV